MHQYKELIDGIDIKYIEMPDKLEYVIFDSELYVNSRLSSSFYVKEDIKTYYVKSNKTNALISLNQIEHSDINDDFSILFKLCFFKSTYYLYFSESKFLYYHNF